MPCKLPSLYWSRTQVRPSPKLGPCSGVQQHPPSSPAVSRSQQTVGKAVKRAFFPGNATQVIGLLLTNDMAAPKINCQRILLTDLMDMGSVHA